MSGVFMDGGGHDHGGHSMHGGGGDGGGFMDGGNHDHGGHSTMHHSGGDGGNGGNFLSNLLGYNDHAGHHSFLSHLLGLDHDAHHGGGHDGGHHGGEGMAPSQSPIWNSALQGLKLSHALEGINISINVWFFFFYAMCIFWLFAIYWIRHHEPLANAVLGRGAAKYETAAADRRIIDNCRDATPIRTSQNQALYAPMPSQFVDPAAQQAIAAAAFNPAAAQAAMPQPAMSQAVAPQMVAPQISIPTLPNTAPQPLSANPANANFVAVSPATQQMASYYNQTTPFGAPTQAQPIASGPAQLIATPMPMAAAGAQRLKMIINK